jgi:SagB-type dehydrogenase family enzyme
VRDEAEHKGVSVVPAPRQTARWVGLVYGSEPSLDDPAECYHEASKISPAQIGRQIEGARRLDTSPALQLSSTRAVKRLGGPRVALPPPRPPSATLWEAIEGRATCRSFAAGALAAADLATILHAGYGVTHVLETDVGRLPLLAVPSGGALYPLELFVAALRVDGLEPGIYHFDPLLPGLEILRGALDAEAIGALSTYPEIASACAALLFVVAVFGRARFKYGLRAYRFALLEAGHLAQNVVLASTALELAAVPLGGFYDRRTDEFLDLDGVNESTLYAIAVGLPA